MQELYDNLLVAFEKIFSQICNSAEDTIKSENGYYMKISSTQITLFDPTFNNKVLISLSNDCDRSEIYRNTIYVTRRKYFIPSLKDGEKYSSIDKDLYFNLALMNHIPTYEHIDFAFKLRNLFIKNKHSYSSLVIHPKFIDLEKLKNTEILFC